MKKYLLIFIIGLSACLYRMVRYGYESSQVVNQAHASDTRLFLKKKLLLGCIDANYLGSLKLTDNGFTTNCSEDTAMRILKTEAHKLNANLINIIDEVAPGVHGTCYRCIVDFYKISADPNTIAIINSATRDTLIYNSNPVSFTNDIDNLACTPGTVILRSTMSLASSAI